MVGMKVTAVYTDFSKAFNTITHFTFFEKMAADGISKLVQKLSSQ